MSRLATLSLPLLLGLPAQVLATGLAETSDAPSTYAPQPSGPVWERPTGFSVLWDNGPLVNCAGCGPGGADESRLQNVTLGMTLFGIGHQQGLNRIADDFTIPSGETWAIQQITVFGYQTGSLSDPSPMVSVNYRIWDGPPGDPGSAVVYGDEILSRFVSSSFANVYRTSEDAPGATNRPVMATVCDGSVVLGPGTYWLDWQSGGVMANSGPWAPPITITGETTTGNARQYLGDQMLWQQVVDLGFQGFPFIIEGSRPVPVEEESWASIKARWVAAD